MRVPAKTRRRQILGAAAKLFSQHGFDGATTRQIAKSAGVNEAIIFRHFASKEELYWAAVAEQIRRRGCAGRLRCFDSSQATAGMLSEVARELLDRSDQDAALTRLLLFSALRNGELSEKYWRTYLGGWLSQVSDCIRHGVKRGWLKPVNAELAARTFLGMIAAQNLIQELFAKPGHQKHDPCRLGQQLADMWLNGVSARPGESAARLFSNGSRRGAVGGSGNGHKPGKRTAGNVSDAVRKHAVTA